LCVSVRGRPRNAATSLGLNPKVPGFEYRRLLPAAKQVFGVVWTHTANRPLVLNVWINLLFYNCSEAGGN
jgi:hypothetical protein